MPVLDVERHSAPRSALRYRPRQRDAQAPGSPGPLVPRTSRAHSPARRPDARTTAAPVWPDDLALDEGEEDLPHQHATGRPAPRRGSASPASGRRRAHPWMFLGLILLAIWLLWVGAVQALAWGNNELNTLKYGYPRTSQTDAVVGHNDSASFPSHFLAINLHGLIEVIEWPGGDSTHVRVFVGPQLFGPNSDLEPVTLRFVKMRGYPLPNMLIDVQGSHMVLINDQGTFRPPTPAEREQLLPYLQ